MSRTNEAAVKGILLSDYGPDKDGNEPSLEPFIDTAASMVDDLVECATAKGKTLSAGKLELIERWLAAHFYVQSDQTYASKSTEGASASFHGQTAMYLESSRYGQTAMRLDTSGCLDGRGGSERKVAGGFWLGKRRSEQIPYVDRD